MNSWMNWAAAESCDPLAINDRLCAHYGHGKIIHLLIFPGYLSAVINQLPAEDK
jgi:hypothetical protein